MAGPDKIPQGSWGGDLDPNTQAQRAQFEAGLSTQQQRLAELHQQAAAGAKPPVRVIDSPPPGPAPAVPQRAVTSDGFVIPAAGQEGGGDLISAMGADLERQQREQAQAAAATGEGAPVPENHVPAPPGRAPGPTGHIPKSLRAQMAVENAAQAELQRQQAAAAPPAPVVPQPQTMGRQVATDAPPPSALARKRGTAEGAVDLRRFVGDIDAVRGAVEAGVIGVDMIADIMRASAELQYAIAEALKGGGR